MAISWKKMVGALLVILLVSGIVYVAFGQEVKIRVDYDKTTIYVFENIRWIVGGREYNRLFDGASRMNRRTAGITIETIIGDNNVTIIRTTPYIRGPVIVDTYYFEGNITNKKMFPIYHTVEIYNGSGFFYRYEVRELFYDGETKKLDVNYMEFGKNISVEWDAEYRWAWVYKTGILKVQYDIPSNYEVYNVRLFDPPKFDVTFEMDSNLARQILYITIENNQDSSDNLDMKTIINSTNFPSDQIKNSRFYEWKSEEVNITDYETLCIPWNETINGSNTTIIEHPNCTEIMTGWHIEERWIWKEKSLTYKQSSNQEYKEYWENVPIAKAGLGKSIKRFKLVFSTPIMETENGWGSSGKIYLDLNGELFYDFEHSSWWDEDYGYRYEIQSSATGIYPINVNDTYAPNIWTLNASSTDGEVKYLYCKVSGCTDNDWAIANETDETPWENETSETGTSITDIYEDDLVGVWHLHRNAVAVDSTKYGFNGTKGGDPVQADGVFGKGQIFDGSGDYYSMGDQVEFEGIQNKELTVSFWAKFGGGAGSHMIVSKWATAPRSFAIYIDNTLNLYVGGGTTYCRVGTVSGGSSGTSDTTWTPETDKWYFYALTVNLTGCYLNVNDTFVFSGQFQSGDLGDNANTKNFKIGSDDDGNDFNGSVDEVRIWNRSLSQSEISDLYNNGINNLAPLGAEEEPFINTTPIVTLYNVTGFTNDNTPGIDFNFTDDDQIAKCYLLLNGTAYNVNDSTINATQTTLIPNVSLTGDEDYAVTVNCSDGTQVGNSSSIILTIDKPPAITITSPTNTTYTTTSIDLNWSADEVLDWAGYELNGATNVTIIWNNEDDTEDAYGCSGSFYVPCSQAVDENWHINSYALSEDGGNWGIVYENTTLPDNVSSANWTYNLRLGGAGDHFKLSYWNYTLDNWQFLVESSIPAKPSGENYTEAIPSDGLNSTNLQMKTEFQCGTYSIYTGYVEGLVTWFGLVYNVTITFQQGSNVIYIWVNDSSGNMNYTKVVFFVDSIPPIITLENPVNNSGTTYDWMWINITTDGTSEWCGYSLNESANITLGNDSATHYYANLTDFARGTQNITFSCNDSYGNMNTSLMYFFDANSTPNISVSLITSPLEMNISSGIITFNYTDQTVYWYNATPNGQNINGTLNVTSDYSGYSSNINVSLNESPTSCMTLYLSNSSSWYNKITLNTSNQTIYTGLAALANQMFWMWVDMINCSVSYTYPGEIVFEGWIP